MASEIVKKQIIIATGELNLPLDCHLPKYKVNAACGAAKLLRNRLLREHSRVLQNVEAIRQEQLFNDNEAVNSDFSEIELKGTAREEFLFVAELMVVEKLALPLLLAHGLAYPDSLLPQLLKLITSVLLPVPRFSMMETAQKDALAKLKQRCGTDECMAFYVQVVAPIAQKRATGTIRREDVVLLEVVLKLLSLLLHGSNENITGSFCRNNGMEMLLVVVNQNYAKKLSLEKDESAGATAGRASSIIKEELAEDDDIAARQMSLSLDPEAMLGAEPASRGHSVTSSYQPEVRANESNTTTQATADTIVLHDDLDIEDGDEAEKDDAELLIVDMAADAEAKMAARFEKEVYRLLEGEEQLWKWNRLLLSCIASALAAAPPEELAQLSQLLTSADGAVSRIGVQRNAAMLQACRRDREKWLHVARSRNGAMASNALLVRRDTLGAAGQPGPSTTLVPVGTVSTLLGSCRRDPLEAIRVMDSRKRGRFVKGMFQGNAPKCTLHIQTQLELAKQTQSFFRYGFEPLNSMVWGRLQSAVGELEEASKSYSETRAGYKQSGEQMEISPPFDANMYDALNTVLQHMAICSSFLGYMRETVRVMMQRMREPGGVPPSSYAQFQELWQSLSSIISLQHLLLGFTVLQLYHKCRDVGRRTDMNTVVVFITELLLAIQVLVEGKVIPDATVRAAAHALASSVLYREDTVKCLFDVLSTSTGFMMPIHQARIFTLFTFAMFQLMEECSYDGTLFVPKAKTNRGRRKKSPAAPTVPKENKEAEAVARDPDPLLPPAELNGSEDLAHGETTRKAAETAPQDEAEEEEEEDEQGEEEEVRSAAPSESRSFQSDYTTTSEKEVAISGILERLTSPKHVWLLVTTLRHWRVNDADVNLALVYLMQAILKTRHGCAFYTISFLLSMREVLVHGKDTHGPLYKVCDQIVFDFFNPAYAHQRDALVTDEAERRLLSGAQSYLGFEVSLRCARSLFTLHPVDYNILEEKGMPHRIENTSMDLPEMYDTAGGFPPPPPVRSESLERLLTAEPVPLRDLNEEARRADAVADDTPDKAQSTREKSQRRRRRDAAEVDVESADSAKPRRRRRTETDTETGTATEGRAGPLSGDSPAKGSLSRLSGRPKSSHRKPKGEATIGELAAHLGISVETEAEEPPPTLTALPTPAPIRPGSLVSEAALLAELEDEFVLFGG